MPPYVCRVRSCRDYGKDFAVVQAQAPLRRELSQSTEAALTSTADVIETSDENTNK